MVIRTLALRKRFESAAVPVEALRGVDLTVERGEFLVIMGPSGSGKTTLLSILGCLEPPTSGEYWLSGQDVAGFDEREAARVRRERIGFVFQGFNLLGRSTAVENVQLPLVYTGVPKQQRHARAMAALTAVGLADRADHLPSQLSGGQQQRVAVARAIVVGPDVVLADEPTGNLDSKSAEEVLDLLTAVHEAGATVVTVTHALEVAERGTRIVRMLDGRIDTEETRVREAHRGAHRTAAGSAPVAP